jgi:NodT family efflux transporter outer membrane factor (OMF) lipoprotein
MKPRRLLPFAALFAACAADPPPASEADLGIDVPTTWGTTETPPDTALLADGWWRSFGDHDLDRLVDAALVGNRDLRAALARLQAAAQSRVIAGANVFPQVDAGLDATRSRRLFLGFPFAGGTPSSTTTTLGLNLNVQWEIDVWGRIRSGEAAAIADLQAAAADHEAARLSLVGQVCKAWFTVGEARQQLELALATADSVRATTEDVRDRYRRGVRPAFDVHLAETNLANAEAAVARRRDLLQQALRQLDVIVGRYPRGATPAPEALPGLPPVPAGLPSDLLQRRPDLAAAERRLAATGCRVEAATAALYPRLSLTASGGTTSTELEDLVDDDFRIWSLGANLLQPLFHGGALRADVARSQALRDEALARYGGAVLRAFAEVEQALAADSLLAARHAALARAADHAGKARDLARQRWQLGIADFLAVADGQRQSYVAEAARIEQERQRLDNRVDLFLALGGGFTVAPARPTPP